ncbi:hypothetical protein EKD04_014950 [Chloroflexales bacterium ZM16-3]|nr:hypothetical protein [Chloroflexales bacterium ZM16-3]
MAPPQIHDFRLSMIWAETNLDLLGESPPATPFSFLERSWSYIERFDQLAQGDGQPNDQGLVLPWPRLGKHFFWTFYLEAAKLATITGNQAWKALVPIRKRDVTRLQAAWLPERVYTEAFLYPFGLVFVITTQSTASRSLDDTVDAAFMARRTGRVEAQLDDTGPSQSLSLDDVATEKLRALRLQVFGPTASPSLMSSEPFTIATIVQGSDIDPTTALVEGDNIHRGLESMANWRQLGPYDVLPPLDEVRVQVRRSPPGDILYGRPRGRVIWFPRVFTQEDRRAKSLACYHRNLVLASIQTESLRGLISAFIKLEPRNRLLPEPILNCARQAAGILTRLYFGKKTYRSGSIRAQIEQDGFLEDLKAARDYFSMGVFQ